MSHQLLARGAFFIFPITMMRHNHLTTDAPTPETDAHSAITMEHAMAWLNNMQAKRAWLPATSPVILDHVSFLERCFTALQNAGLHEQTAMLRERMASILAPQQAGECAKKFPF